MTALVPDTAGSDQLSGIPGSGIVDCPICDSSRWTLPQDVNRFPGLYVCVHCGLTFNDPRPQAEPGYKFNSEEAQCRNCGQAIFRPRYGHSYISNGQWRHDGEVGPWQHKWTFSLACTEERRQS